MGSNEYYSFCSLTVRSSSVCKASWRACTLNSRQLQTETVSPDDLPHTLSLTLSLATHTVWEYVKYCYQTLMSTVLVFSFLECEK